MSHELLPKGLDDALARDAVKPKLITYLIRRIS